jgi:proteasome alpha subunit
MAAIELASTEGFARSAADVSLRRLAYYSLSPLMKNAFEQIYGAPFLARLLFAELGDSPAEDLFLRVEYDGAIGQKKSGNKHFAVLAPTKKSAEQMEQFLEREDPGDESISAALELAFDAWAAGQKVLEEGAALPAREEIRAYRRERLSDGIVEAAVLDRHARSPVQYRAVEEKQLRALHERA